MAEIRETPPNSFKVVSTFAGCGGSSTGYRIAGFKVRWANEFVPAARDTYLANSDPATIVDSRDIRIVQPGEILEAIGLKVGELDILDGSPPCASFSTAGKREKHWGEVKKYSDTEQRTDDLFAEFVRILDGLQPKVFVAENVSGLIKGAAKGYFLEILAALKGCGYRVTAKLLDAQWLGVPQARQRIIFIGVRDDLKLLPAYPLPLSYRYSIREALPWVKSAKAPVTLSGFGKGRLKERVDEPSQTVNTADLGAGDDHYIIERETDISRFAIGEEWGRLLPGGQSEKYFSLVRPDANGPSPTITAEGGVSSLASVTHPTERRKFSIAELKRICGFPDDFILTGSYSQQWERLGRSVPPVMMAAIATEIRDQILRKL